MTSFSPLGWLRSNHTKRLQRRRKVRHPRLVEALEERTLLSAGTLDPTFGVAGKVLTDFVGSARDNAQDIVMQPDGKFVVAGTSSDAADFDFALARYNSDGSLDSTFGNNGQVVTHLFGDDRLGGLALQADGKIVVAGTTTGSGVNDFAVVRYHADGTLDASFGAGGVVTTDFPGNDNALGVAIQSDGKIVAIGSSVSQATPSLGFALARYNSDGTLDTSFDGDGKVVTTGFDAVAGAAAHDLTIQSDGKILVVGGGGAHFLLARYNDDGSLDTGFDGDGRVATPVTSTGTQVNGVSLQSDGKIVVAGISGAGSLSSLAVARYHSNGSLDTSFNAGGALPGFAFVSQLFSASDLTIQGDGKILAVGHDRDAGVNDFAAARFNSDGTLDGGFGLFGIVKTNVGSGLFASDEANAVLLQQDGKIVVAGRSGGGAGLGPSDFGLVRYNTDGGLDAAFDGDGIVTTDFPGSRADVGKDVAVQPDGKIVVLGTARSLSQSSDLVLLRYNLDGTLDPTFGTEGIVATEPGFFADSHAITLQADGKIVVAGESATGTAAGEPDFDFALARFNTDGSLDAGFGDAGKVTIDFGGDQEAADDLLAQFPGLPTQHTFFAAIGDDVALDVVVQPDGKIVAVGSAEQHTRLFDLSFGVDEDVDVQTDFAVARLNSDGTVDSSFGTDGLVKTDFGSILRGTEGATGVALQDDGKIVVAGNTFTFETIRDFAVARYESDGTLDISFDGDGMVVTPFDSAKDDSDDRVAGVVVQDDGRIVVAGTTQVSFRHDFALVGYRADGSLDPQFGNAGKVTTSFDKDTSSGANSAQASAVAVQADGKLLVAGRFVGRDVFPGGDQDFALVRYTAKGKKLDTTFGNDGKVTTDFGSRAVEEPLGLAIQPDGKIVLAGVSTRETTSSDFALARYEALANAEAIDEIGEIGDDVEALLTAGVLNNGQATSLLSKLGDAVQLLEDDKITPAVHKLEDFISEVSNFINNGTLTSAQGQPLIDAAEEVLNLLLNDPLMAGVDAVFSEFDLLDELRVFD